MPSRRRSKEQWVFKAIVSWAHHMKSASQLSLFTVLFFPDSKQVPITAGLTENLLVSGWTGSVYFFTKYEIYFKAYIICNYNSSFIICANTAC